MTIDLDEFSKRIHEARSSFELRRNEGRTDALLSALDQAFEELLVAEEELRQQNEALLAAQRALERQQRRYRDLFESAPDAYIITSADGTIRDVNHTALELLRLNARAVLDKPLIVFIAPPERRSFRNLLARLPQLRKVVDWEVMFQPRQMPGWPGSVSVSAVSSSESSALELRWLVRDVSERRRLYEELRAAKDALEQRLETLD
jgi:PAS domain S-box-containing protein